MSTPRPDEWTLLEAGEAPERKSDRIEVRARTALGNIVIRRPKEAR